MGERYTFGKGEKLKSRKQIDFLFDKGKKFNTGFFRVSYQVESSEKKSVQVAVGVSSKSFKKATDRNRIKRLIKESYRLQKNELLESILRVPKQLYVFIIYTGKEIPDYKQVYSQMENLLKKLDLILKGSV